MNELITELVSKLGVQDNQAKGGVGLILKLAKDSLGGDFSKLSAALPGASELMAAAPQSGGAAKLLGGLAGALGGQKARGLAGLASLAGGFSKLNLDSGMVSKFVPIVAAFVKSKAGPDIAALLSKALQS
ncbi:MAG: DUF2780 domain-containing protein [Lentisphaerae bacterium]|nr:DUF2780 domain-containing protein [Lentisphaerota bacterium]